MNDIRTYMEEQISTNIPTNTMANTSTNIPTTSTNIPTTSTNLSTIFNDNLTSLATILNPTIQHKKAYILLDRRFKSYESPDKTTITWNFSNTANVSDGSVNFNAEINKIISLKISDFFINFVNSKYISPEKRITILIHELAGQSFIAHENRKFHFYGKLNSNLVTEAPMYLAMFSKGNDLVGQYESYGRLSDYNDGLFTFKTPIIDLHTISISFASPLQKITLQQDKYSFVYNGFGNIGLTPDHNIATASQKFRVYVEGFNTDNPSADADIIKIINRPIGLFAQQLSTSTLLLIAVDEETTGLIQTLPALVGNQLNGATIYLDYYRFNIPIEITYV